ncbi:MAG: hypothetical protein ACRC18_06945 [Cetobacterium sp.]
MDKTLEDALMYFDMLLFPPIGVRSRIVRSELIEVTGEDYKYEYACYDKDGEFIISLWVDELNDSGMLEENCYDFLDEDQDDLYY